SWTVAEFDLDVELAKFLSDLEAFLAPERRFRAELIEPAAVGRCVAAKEALARLLAGRVVAISADDPGRAAVEAARAALAEACRADLRNFYAVGAVAMLRLHAEAASPLEVHGRFVSAAKSAPAVLASSVRMAAQENPVAFPVGVRAEEIRGAFELPGSFRCDAISLDGRDGDGKRRTLRFVTDADTSVPAPPLRARVPWRAVPQPPRLLKQDWLAGEGESIEAARSWRLKCDYAADPVPADTLRFGVELSTSGPPPRAVEQQRPDLLDALVIFRMKLPAIVIELDRGLRPPARATVVPAGAAVRDAIRAFATLVEGVARHFAVPATEPIEPLGELEERRDVTPLAAGSITTGPFDITRQADARCSLQMVRNFDATIARAFHYPTRALRAAESVEAFIDRELRIDIAQLPPLDDSMRGDLRPGSLDDSLTRLLVAVVVAPGPKAGGPKLAGRVQVEFVSRLPGMGPGAPEVRVPVVMVPSWLLSASRHPSEIRKWARLVAAQIETWLAQSDPRSRSGAQSDGARLAFDLTLSMVDRPEKPDRPILRLRELFLACPAGGATVRR
ncbi:MAG TPA: hypothetical protein VG710_05620, partial [Opitutus sp.]|nr:hypothetical protein [Opitutus sp.]